MANDPQLLLNEIRNCIVVYHNLCDDLADQPEWQRKVQDEVGDQVIIAYKRIHEITRKELAVEDPVWERVDSEK